MNQAVVANMFDRTRLAPIADGLAVAVAVSLPWSTSATSILIVLWLIAVLPTLDVASVRREGMTPAGGLPVLLWALGALGMLWADASWGDRLHGLGSFHKLLVIPLLLAQFRRSERGNWVVIGFLGSALVLLVVSWGLALIPGLTWRGNNGTGVPVKDYILQSGIFALCAFGLLAQAVELWRARRRRLALVLALVAALFIANIFYVVTGRTTIVVMVVLLLMFGLWVFGWKGVLAAGLIGAVLASLIWVSSPYLRERVTRIAADIHEYRTNLNTPVGLRLEFWRQVDRLRRAGAAHRPRNRDHQGAVSGRCDRRNRSRGDHDQSSQSNLDGGASARPGRDPRVDRDVDRSSHVVPRRGLDVLVRDDGRGREYRVVVVQFAPVRFHPRLALRLRRRSHRRPRARPRARHGRHRGQGMNAQTAHDVLVPISVGELMDKITILEIKSERIKDPVKLENIARELGALRAVRLGDGIDRTTLDRLAAELTRVNARLWEVEDEIRECEAQGDFGEKFIALARAVYELNDERARLKKAINLASGSRLVEEKSYKSFEREGSDQGR